MSYERSITSRTSHPSLNENNNVSAPVLSINEATPNQWTLSWSSINGYSNYQLAISTDNQIGLEDTFYQIVNATTKTETAEAGAFTDFYAQVRGYNSEEDASEWSSLVFVVIDDVIQLPDLLPQAQAGDAQVTLTYTDTATGLSSIDLQQKTSAESVWTTVATNIGSSPYFVTLLINGTSYDFRLVANPTNFNYSTKVSSVATATPQLNTPTLSTPSSLSVEWDEVTGGSGTFSFVDNSAGNADNFSVVIKLTSNGSTVQSTTLTAPTVSYAFTGLSINTSYTFEVTATGAGFTNSETATIIRVAPDPNATFVDPDTDYGAVPYYKPLDGRQLDLTDYGSTGTLDMPLIDYNPLTESEFNALSTGLTYSTYTNGATQITAKSNDQLGTTLSNVFTANDVGKRFCGLNNNLNPATDNTYSDLYVGGSISARYCNVIAVDTINGEWAVVDFEFNGGNRVTPQNQSNGQGYIFHDNSTALTTAFNAMNSLSVASEMRLTPMTRSNYVLTVYVAPQLEVTNVSRAGNIKIYTGNASTKSRIKFGIEDYYWAELYRTSRFYKNAVSPDALFKFNGYAYQWVSHNVQWIPPHGYWINADPSKYNEKMFSGTLSGGGVAMVVNGENQAEKTELSNGGNIINRYKFRIGVGSIGNSGTFTGDGSVVTHDVDEFGFDVHINCHYAGAYSAGQKGGGTRGATYNIWKDCTFDFENQNFYSPPTTAFETKFTTDYSGINNTGDNNDPSTFTHFPSHCLEITSGLGTWYDVRAMGGNMRVNILHIDKFIFHANNTRVNQIEGYYTHCYHRDENKLLVTISSSGEAAEGRNTISAKKIMVDWEIPVVGTVCTISRDYYAGRSDGQLKTVSGAALIPTLGIPVRNAIRTHVNWPLVLQKYIIDFTADDLNWINGSTLPINRKPQEFQINDQFKICAWLEVDDDTSFSNGDNLTIKNLGGTTIATGTLQFIDNHKYTRRFIIKSCTADITTAATVTNNTTTANVTSSSTYNPTVIYTCKRKQAGHYVSNTLKTATDGDGVTWNYYDGEYSRGCTYSELPSDTGVNDGGQIIDFNNLDGYYYSYLHVYPDLPDDINGVDTVNPAFEVEVVTSGAEFLLDGQSRQTRTTYRSLDRLASGSTNTLITSVRRRFTTANSGFTNDGYGYNAISTELNGTYADGLDGRSLITFGLPTSFDSVSWTSIGEALGHGMYNVGENTYYIRGCDCKNSYARVNRTTVPSTYLSSTLARFSKGWVLTNNSNMFTGQWYAPEKGSTRDQWQTQYEVYQANPEYVAAYATSEGMNTPPRLELYGTDAFIASNYTGHTNTSGENIVVDSDANNAPDLPNTILTILASLPQ